MIIGIDASNIRGGGGVTHLAELLRAAEPSAHGFSQVIVWTGGATLAAIEDRPWLVKVRESALDRALPFRSFWQTFMLTKRALAAGCDVLFVPGGWYVGTFHPVVTFHQNLVPFQWHELRRFGVSWMSAKMLLLRAIQTRTFRRAEGLICLTRHAQDLVMRVVRRTAGKIVVIPHGIDRRFACQPRQQFPITNYSPERPFRLLYVSIINVYKHQWHVAEAVARLRAEGLPVALEFVGPAYRPALRRLNATLKRVDPEGEFIRYSGPIPYEQLHTAYASADLCVFASTCETFGQILTEGMLAGLPIASSNQAAMPELLGDAGLYFDPEKPEEIVQALRELILSPELRAEKSEAAFRRAAQFSWSRCASDTFAHLSEVAATNLAKRGRATLELWRNPQTDVRIAVDRWCVHRPIGDQFMERPLSGRLVWNYLRHIGVVAVLRKIRSRLSERVRNRKIAGSGIGRVLEAPAASNVTVGQQVVFFAPNHSIGWPRISVDARFVQPAANAPARGAVHLPDVLQAYAGWSPFSGKAVDERAVRRELERIAPQCAPTSRHTASGKAMPRNRYAPPAKRPEDISRVPSAVLFGLGNYAKTQILPHVRSHLRLEAIHEVDPDQFARIARPGVRLDTSPVPNSSEQYDAWFIAGFHHTHASIAMRALSTGAYAVVEKPLVTTRADFTDLQALIARSGSSKLFTCFQRRYSRIDEWTRADLGVRPGDPVDMHCLVYEIPLPSLHWYNWPNSGSRLVSNGCHWLDYFVHVNAYSPVISSHVEPLRDDDVVVTAQLANGAQLAMSLTERGSERLGVRDLIDLRAGDATVRITDSCHYHAENTRRIIRRRRAHPLEAYGQMYDTICRRILAGTDGDPLESLRSTALMLDLEEELQSKRRGAAAGRSHGSVMSESRS